MTEVTIRRAGPEDAEALGHTGVATFLETYAGIVARRDMIAHCTRQHSRAVYAAYLADPHAAVWIAEHAVTGAPVGYAVNCPPDLPLPAEPGDRELKRIYMLSRFHGSGAGRALMAASLTEAQARGAGHLLLGTYQDNHRAIAFYRKNGFALTGRRQFQVGDTLFDDVVMARRLG